MVPGTVVVASGLPAERFPLERLVSEFGWSLELAGDLNELEAHSRDRRVVAVLFSPMQLALPWDEALRRVLRASPGTLPILCHRFGEPVDWPRAAKAGAFHSLQMPFSEQEVRQSLGFAWSARFRRESLPALVADVA